MLTNREITFINLTKTFSQIVLTNHLRGLATMMNPYTKMQSSLVLINGLRNRSLMMEQRHLDFHFIYIGLLKAVLAFQTGLLRSDLMTRQKLWCFLAFTAIVRKKTNILDLLEQTSEDS